MCPPKLDHSECAPILIVEDDQEIRELCRMLLETEGYSVQTCINGKEAMEFLADHPEPCLILLDMMMPIMNGKEFMKVFSDRPHTVVPIPIFLVSASALDREGKEIGCLGFLKKPFDVDALLSIVRSHCKVHH